ncbi:SixA phosphatase family protein [Sneathiella glossodoripedis]|uniref:SixA phosphatase family protein n=1 Tax=Sneathiella glossodoripedis TaxID=418853 RepID=UPI0005618A7E|nr:histidine phosphatase family protein [Sneathiella glossodoripedis]
MTKILTLMRHAKSSWEDYSQSDLDRPLAPRGKKAAPKMGQYLYENSLSPDLVICSPAQRTRETLSRLQTAFPDPLPVKYDKMVYSAGMGHGLIPLLHNMSDELQHIMILGHNPAMQELSLALISWTDDQEETRQKILRKFSTGAITSMQFEGDSWSAVNLGKGRLSHFASPKQLA